VVWGLLHGVALCVERILGLNKKEWHGICKILQIIATIFIVSLFWVFFRANTLEDGVRCLYEIFTNPQIPSVGRQEKVFVTSAILVTFIAEYCIEYKKVVITEQNYLRTYVLCGFGILLAIYFFGVFNGGQFIYFQF
jgi:D-alanyl-lipoteichoic acid acyltransferase DltB (MBOAT superfamily)